MNISWEALSPEQKEEFLRQAEAEKQRQQSEREAERLRYKQLAELSVDEIFTKLETANAQLSDLKREAFDTLNTLAVMKKELYVTTQRNKSHTFTNANSTRSITIGSRDIEGWDGTEAEGVELINEYLSSKVADDELRAILGELLKRDKEGQLNKHRVMSLAKLKERVSDPKFREGVDVILSAYKPQRTAIFVEAKQRSGLAQKWRPLPLSFAAVDAAE